MPKIHPFTRTVLIIALLVFAGAGCTKEARKARQLDKAKSDFESGAYDKAKIEYLNVLRLGGQTPDPAVFARLGEIWFEEGAPLKAGAFLVKARELAPNDLENRLRLARVYKAMGNLAEAKKEILFILQQSPDNGEALLLLTEISSTPDEVKAAEQTLQQFPKKESVLFQLAAANIALRKSDPGRAQELIAHAISLDPKSAKAHLSMAIVHLFQKDSKSAAAEFKTAADLAPPRSSMKMSYAEFEVQTGEVDKAVAYLKELTSQTPDFFPAWALLSRIAFTQKKYDEALALLENILSRDPDNPDARLLQAKNWLAKQENKKAIDGLERLSHSYPSSPAIKFELARAYLQDNKSAQATAALTAAIVASPNYPDAVLLLAQINLKNGQAATAVSALEGLLQKQPGLKQAQTLLADAYRAVGRLDDAAALLRQQIEKAPAQAEPYLLLGLIQRQQKKHEEARHSFEKVLELAPDNIEALNQLVELNLVAGDFAEALRMVQRQKEKKPGDGAPYLLEAKVRTAKKEWAEAEAALKKAIELNPELASAYDLLVAIYLATDRLPQAKSELETIISKSPRNEGALMTLALIKEKQKDYAGAAEAYEKVLAFKGNSMPALNNLSYLYSERLNQSAKALELARKARALAPSNAFVADTLGWVLFQQGEYRQALDLSEEAAGKSDNPEIQYHLGMAYYMMGNADPAQSAFQRALSSTADFPSRADAQRRLDLLSQASGPNALSAKQLEEMLGQHPKDVVARIRLAEAYEKTGAFDQAATAYEEALKSNPKLGPATLKLAQLYAGPLHNAKKAMEFAKKARELSPGDARVAGVLGKIAFDAGNFSWAYSLLQESSRQLSSDPQVLHDLAWAAYSLGKIDQAQEAMQQCLNASPDSQIASAAKSFLVLTKAEQDPAALAAARPEIEKSLKQDPQDVPALMAAAALDIQAGAKKDAVARYQKVLQRFPAFGLAQKQLALIYSEDPARKDEAYALAVKARESLPADPAVAQMMGQLSYERKDYSRALQLLQESARKKPLDAEGLYYLGLSYKEAKQPAEARKALTAALAAGLSSPSAGVAQRTLAELNK